MDSTDGNFGKKLLRLRLIVSMHLMSVRLEARTQGDESDGMSRTR